MSYSINLSVHTDETGAKFVVVDNVSIPADQNPGSIQINGHIVPAGEGGYQTVGITANGQSASAGYSVAAPVVEQAAPTDAVDPNAPTEPSDVPPTDQPPTQEISL